MGCFFFVFPSPTICGILERFPFQHLLEEEKKEKQALVAVARKILVIGRALLINQQPYIDNYQLVSH